MDKYILKGGLIALIITAVFVLYMQYASTAAFWHFALAASGILTVYLIFRIFTTVNRYIIKVH